jgi:polyprenyl-phospho-N-acetylgalactosaminyl synthase
MATTPRTRISAIVPAHDEAATIVGVVTPLVGHPLVDEVIVVNDGSRDATGTLAREAGARVISLQHTQGKAAAMQWGTQIARHGILLFCDADLIGLSADKISSIVLPVLDGRHDMHVGIRARHAYWANRLLRFTPIIGGERALRREIWDQVPQEYKRNFQIEIALNFFAKQNGHRMGITVLHGLGQVIKERKRGSLVGLWQRLLMIRDILLVGWRVYVVLQARMRVERHLHRRKRLERVQAGNVRA